MIGDKDRGAPDGSAVFGHAEFNATMRRIKYGPIRPMQEPTFLQRLFGRN